MTDLTSENGSFGPSGLFGLAIHVFDRSVDSHRETSSPWQTTHETHTVASQKQLEGTRVPRKGHTHSKVAPPSSKMVAGGRQCAPCQPLHPLNHTLQIFTDLSKQGWGAHLNEHSNKLSRTKGGLFDPKGVPRPLPEQHSSYSHRQHHSGCLHKQGGEDEVRPSV